MLYLYAAFADDIWRLANLIVKCSAKECSPNFLDALYNLKKYRVQAARNYYQHAHGIHSGYQPGELWNRQGTAKPEHSSDVDFKALTEEERMVWINKSNEIYRNKFYAFHSKYKKHFKIPVFLYTTRKSPAVHTLAT